MDFGIKGKTALVSAGSKGLGKASATALAAEGCNIAICSRDNTTLQATASEIREKYGVKVFAEVCDINSNDEIIRFVKNAQQSLGVIDILVNNCGGPSAGYFEQFAESDWDFAYQQILMSVVTFIKQVLPDMKENKWGRIINITSVSAVQPVDNLLLSTTFRTGLMGFSKTLSSEYAKYNITVNSVAPGYILTDRLKELSEKRATQGNISYEEALAGLSRNCPMERTGKPEEIGNTVAFLASQQASYLTGNTIHVTGGLVKGIF